MEGMKRWLTALLLGAVLPAFPADPAVTVESFQAAYRRSLKEEARRDLIVSLGRCRDKRVPGILARLAVEERNSAFLQAWIVKTLCEDIGSAEAVKAAAACLKDDRALPVVALVARQFLAHVAEPEGIAWLAGEGMKDRALREDALWALAQNEDCRDPAPFLGRLLLKSEKDWRLRAAAAAGLWRLADPATAPRIMEALAAETAPPVQRYLLAAGGRIAPVEAMPFLRAGRALPDHRTRLGALEGLAAAVREPACRTEALRLMVDTVAIEHSRLRDDAVRALERITGRKLGYDVPAWRAYLQELGMPSPSGELARTPAAEYFGMTLSSRRVVLVLEASKLMVWDRRSFQPLQRLATAKRELARLIDALPEDAAFSVLAFGATPSAWKEALVLATPEHKRLARIWVEQQGGTGLPDFGAAFAAAWGIGMPPAAGEAVPPDTGADTVVLVSNGEPLWGSMGGNDLQRWVMVEGRYRSVTVHTVGIGSGGERGFLKSLAAQTGGGFRNVD